ncbi:MAG: hypothetical protein ACRDS9_23570 [Pseudonocardiaceae bacterium]
MSDIYQATMTAYDGAGSAAPGAWDLLSFLENANAYLQIAGGALLMLLGVACLIWGGVVCVKKLTASAQAASQEHWSKIVVLILVGGAFMGGGWPLISKIGSGGEKTITELGGGTIVIGALTAPGARSVLGDSTDTHTEADNADALSPAHADRDGSVIGGA